MGKDRFLISGVGKSCASRIFACALLLMSACQSSEIAPDFLGISNPLPSPSPVVFIPELDSSWAPAWANIVSVWHFNESSFNGTAGEVKDSSGHNYLGTASGVVTTTSGKFNGAAFLGQVSNINIDFTGLTSTQKSYSLSVWLNVSSTGGCRYLLTTNYPTLIFATSNCAGNLGYYDGNWHDLGAAIITDGNWHHYVWVLDSVVGTGTIYQDGIQLGSSAYVGQNISGTILFGGYTSSVVEGTIDDVGLWEVALTAAQVHLIFDHQSRTQ